MGREKSIVEGTADGCFVKSQVSSLKSQGGTTETWDSC
jgi:hypothetical protein